MLWLRQWGMGWGGCMLALLCGCAQPESPAATKPSEFIAFANELEVAPPADPAMAKLVAAYPDFLVGTDGNYILWKDGTRMVWDDGRGHKTFEELEADADLQDMFTYTYPKDSVIVRQDFDPGRIRNEAFFKKMYGATAADVERQLVSRDWIGGVASLKITRVNGVDRALDAVSAELLAMPAVKKYLTTPGGTFNWRTIAGTNRLSAHSFGIAVDINVGFSDYWRWSPEFKAGKPLRYHNQIPMEIVRVFERHGFIWGGKWYHYDTMHFEYRPELL